LPARNRHAVAMICVSRACRQVELRSGQSVWKVLEGQREAPFGTEAVSLAYGQNDWCRATVSNQCSVHSSKEQLGEVKVNCLSTHKSWCRNTGKRRCSP
jgi:hypothetical protein